jgi:hypothetical protein
MASDMADQGMGAALIESGQLHPIRPAESVAGRRSIIENLTAEQAGRFINYDGAEIPC